MKRDKEERREKAKEKGGRERKKRDSQWGGEKVRTRMEDLEESSKKKK